MYVEYVYVTYLSKCLSGRYTGSLQYIPSHSVNLASLKTGETSAIGLSPR